MRTKSFIISMLAICALAAATMGIVFAYTPLSGPLAVSSQGTLPLTPGPALDDFNSGTAVNLWRGSTSTFAKDGSTAATAAAYPDSPDPVTGAPGKCLQLTYNVNEAASYAGYSSSFGGGSIGPYTDISFYVKGSVAGLFCKVELKNTSTTSYGPFQGTNYYRNSASVYISDFLDGGVTTNWQKVTIPIKNFANLDGVTSMNEFVIVFENSQSVANGSPTQGTLYIDNIFFTQDPVNIVRADHYGDALGVCNLGGNIGNSGSVIYSFTSSAAHNFNNGLKLDYSVPTLGSYAYVFSIFGGGNNSDPPMTDPSKAGWIPIAVDLSTYTNITFQVRAENNDKNPQGIKIELHDYTGIGTGEPFYSINRSLPASSRIDIVWQKFTIALSSFKDWSNVVLDKTRVSELVFTFEYSNAVDKTGTVYIDEVQFE